MFGIYLKDEINLSAGTMWIQIRPNASEKWKLIIGICKFFHQMESVEIFGGVCHRHCVNWIWNSEENWRQRPWILDFHLNLTMSNTERRRRRLWKVLWTAWKRHFVNNKTTINFSDSKVRILRSDGISWHSAAFSESVSHVFSNRIFWAYFYRTQVNLGSDLWVRMSLRHLCET